MLETISEQAVAMFGIIYGFGIALKVMEKVEGLKGRVLTLLLAPVTIIMSPMLLAVHLLSKLELNTKRSVRIPPTG